MKAISTFFSSDHKTTPTLIIIITALFLLSFSLFFAVKHFSDASSFQLPIRSFSSVTTGNTSAVSSPPPDRIQLPPPSSDAVVRTGIVDENGAMTADFVVGDFDPAVLESVVNVTSGNVRGDGKGRNSSSSSSVAKIGKFRVCDESLREYVPCLDNVDAISKLNSTERGENYQRHCPGRGLDCLVPRPKGYKDHIPWPQSRDEMHKQKGSGLEPWPLRLTAASPRLEETGVSSDEFHKDTSIWGSRVVEYWKQMKTVIQRNSIRNVMDMNSNLGGFAAALNDMDVWVMNVAPTNMSSRLKIIYDRGLIGTVHDWCESFSTYPRTYDLLHAWAVFSEVEENGCSTVDLLIEMDRILRPDGFVIIRDKPSVINRVRKFLSALRWNKWLLEVEPRTDALSVSEERVLFVRKKMWDEEVTSL